MYLKTQTRPIKTKGEQIMAFMTDANKFKKIQESLQQKQKERGSGNKFNDDRFIKFDINNTYKFRLLYFIPDNSKRELPFVSKYKHLVKDADNKWHGVTCPTTVDTTSAGYERCPLCKNNRHLFKSELESDKALYKNFRRRFDGYAPVYVINDPTNPANNGQVKIMRYGVTIDKWLKKEIFGIGTSSEGDEEDDITDTIGLDAFSLDKGYDLIVEVTKKGEWPSYDCKFARKASALNVDVEKLEADCEALNIEAEYSMSSDSELLAFYNKFVLDIATSESADVDVDVSAQVKPVASTTPAKTTTVKVEKAKVAPVKAPTPTADDSDIDLSDIEDLLNGLEE